MDTRVKTAYDAEYVLSEFALGRRRVELEDFSAAIRLGGMRAGDEGAADLGAVPAGLHPETKRLFGFDMARREILHEMLSGLKRAITHRARGEILRERLFSFSSHRKAG